MKSLVAESVATHYPATHKLIYVDLPNGHREALAMFALDAEGVEAYKAEKKAKRRLANILFQGINEDSDFSTYIAVLTDKDNVKITDNVKAVNVRLAENLNDFDPDTEFHFNWTQNDASNMKPFCGGSGVVDAPYTISLRKDMPVFYRIIATTEDLI